MTGMSVKTSVNISQESVLVWTAQRELLFCRDFIVMSSAESANFTGLLLLSVKTIIELHK